jgi:hypothetical protein
MKFFAAYIMRGRLEAILTASTLAVLSMLFTPLSIVSSATVALVTLRKGAKEGIIILACSCLVAGMMSALLQVSYFIALIFAVLLWLPVWLIAFVLREGRLISLAVEIAVLLGVVGAISFYLFYPDPALMWKDLLPQMVPPKANVANIQDMIAELAPYATGMFAAGVVNIMLFGLFLGRWWQSVLYNPGGFKEEFLTLSAKPRLSLICIAIVAVALISQGKISEIAWNAAIIMFVMYVFIGTSVLHPIFARMNMGNLAVPMFYVTLFLIPHVLLPVALVGLLDSWLDLRKIKINKT